jgi:hypothetical protein
MLFNPFDKQIGEPLTLNDLQLLKTRGIAEGLYVEYKSDFRTYEKIGQSIASFANSYGGWYFIGIEADKTHNLPANFFGIDIRVHNDPISRIRDAVKVHVNPTPAFTIQLVSLNEHKVVIVVQVPSYQDKPFISSDGRIYRRVTDSSDPISEKDRYAVDRLYSEGRRYRKIFAEFCKDDFIFDDMEHRGWLKLYIAPYPNDIHNDSYMEQETVKKLLLKSKDSLHIPYYDVSLNMGMPFDVGYSTYEAIMLRQVGSNPVVANPLSIELYSDGWAKFFIPIPFFHKFNWNDIESLNSSRTKEALRTILGQGHLEMLESLRFIDVGALSAIIATLVTFYMDWVGEQPATNEFRYAAVIEDIRRTVPFFDSDKWGEFVAEFGLPVNGRKIINIRPSSENWFSWGADRSFPLWQIISLMISYAFGLPEPLYQKALHEWAKRNSKS